MNKLSILIEQEFNAPVDIIFNLLTNHESFGKIINMKIKRVVDSPGDNKNGKGSVRSIKPFLLPAFEETVVEYYANERMEYVVSKGSPVKNHRGCMIFSAVQGKTHLAYTIDFEPKLPFIFLGAVIKKAIENPISKGLKKVADQFENELGANDLPNSKQPLTPPTGKNP